MKKLVIFGITLLLAACSHFPASAPKAEKSEYFDVMGGGFSVVRQEQKYFYGINVLRNKAIPDDAYIVVTFENPGDATRPFVQEGLFSALPAYKGSNAYALKSPEVTGIRPHRNYMVGIKLYADSGKSQLLGELNQGVNSDLLRN